MLVPPGPAATLPLMISLWRKTEIHTGSARGYTMGKDETATPAQQQKMDKFTTSTKSRMDDQRLGVDNTGTVRFAEILDSIQASRKALEGQIGGVQVK